MVETVSVRAQDGPRTAERSGSASSGPRRLVLVVSHAGFSLFSGAGQRTRLYFEACLRLGPTDMVVLDTRMTEDHVRRDYPEADRVRIVNPRNYVTLGDRIRSKGRLLLVFAAPRFLTRPDADLERALAELSEGHDPVGFVFRFTRGYFTSGLPAKGTAGRLAAVDVDDRDDQKYRSYLSARLGWRWVARVFDSLLVSRLAAQMRRALARADLVWFTSDEDRWDLAPAVVSVVPNATLLKTVPEGLPPPSEGTDVLFLGIYSHAPNRNGVRWFLQHCWPTVSEACPECRLRIAGTGEWDELGRDWANADRIDFVGFVEDVGTEYARARLAICPIDEGGGSKVKIVEGCVFGRPVVIRPHSARGLAPDLVAELPVAGDAEAFSRACIAYLQNPEEADLKGRRLSILQGLHHSRDAVLQRITDDLQEAFGRLANSRIPHSQQGRAGRGDILPSDGATHRQDQ